MMKEIGIYIVKISAFLFIAAGAALGSVGMPLADYAKEARFLQFKVEKDIGLPLSEENCTPEIALEHIADCRSALYTQNVTVTLNRLLNRFVNIFLFCGVLCFLAGSAMYIKAAWAERKESKEKDI